MTRGSKTTPDIEAAVVAGRLAGWSVIRIAERTGASPATCKRIISRHRAERGAINQELVAVARQELFDAVTGDERLRRIYASAAIDLLDQIELAREKAVIAIDHLQPTDTKTAALTLRAIVAHSTALKGHADAIAKVLPRPHADQDELPVLVVETMTQQDIAEMRRQQQQEERLLNGEPDELNDEALNTDDDVIEEG